MKTRIILIAAACAALAACSKENAAIDNFSEDTAFKEGQLVTIGVGSGKVSTRVVGTDDGTNINLTWETGDKILVKVGDKSAEFTLSSGAGTDEAEFKGKMPGSGDEFDIQYPVETPDLSSQTYEAGKIPAGKMSFTEEGCMLDETSFLTAGFSVLQLNFTGTQAISKIVVETVDATPAKSYTLNINEAVTLTSTAKAFYVVTDKIEEKLKVTVCDNASPSDADFCNFTTANAIDLSAGECVYMNEKAIEGSDLYPGTTSKGITIDGVTWAPVNCGYDATNTYGLLYQWGRKYGQAYSLGEITPKKLQMADGQLESNKNKFGSYLYSDYNNWFPGEVDNTLWVENSKGDYDPCPDGWRVPTYDELNSLISSYNYIKDEAHTVGGVSQAGFWFNGTKTKAKGSGVFLPLAGFREYSDGSVAGLDETAGYWSSTTNSYYAKDLVIEDLTIIIDDEGPRATGGAVRCVKVDE